MPGFDTVGTVAIAMSDVSLRRFTVLNALGALLWAVTLAAAGYLLGNVLELVLGDLSGSRSHCWRASSSWPWSGSRGATSGITRRAPQLRPNLALQADQDQPEAAVAAQGRRAMRLGGPAQPPRISMAARHEGTQRRSSASAARLVDCDDCTPKKHRHETAGLVVNSCLGAEEWRVVRSHSLRTRLPKWTSTSCLRSFRTRRRQPSCLAPWPDRVHPDHPDERHHRSDPQPEHDRRRRSPRTRLKSDIPRLEAPGAADEPGGPPCDRQRGSADGARHPGLRQRLRPE